MFVTFDLITCKWENLKIAEQLRVNDFERIREGLNEMKVLEKMPLRKSIIKDT